MSKLIPQFAAFLGIRKANESSRSHAARMPMYTNRDLIDFTKKPLALIIPAHNEELVISSTIRSAIAASQPRTDIFVVDDASRDQTAAIARRLLGRDHVLSVKHSGKAGAIYKAVRHFAIVQRYRWIHIADADGVFGKDYFSTFTKRLDDTKYVAATGHVQSLRGDWVSKYRTYEYTLGLELYRRIQSWFGVISVIPGASACFASRIFDKLNFQTHSMTEDFDLTLQIHRKRLGKILYIPAAKTFTQDPKNYHDYVTQLKRWYRGFWQGVIAHRVLFRGQGIDFYLGYILLETLVVLVQLATLPVIAIVTDQPHLLAVSFLTDFALFLLITLGAAFLNQRWDILAAFPLFYLLRFTNIAIFSWAFVEVVILRRFRIGPVGWETAGRRYQIAG